MCENSGFLLSWSHIPTWHNDTTSIVNMLNTYKKVKLHVKLCIVYIESVTEHQKWKAHTRVLYGNCQYITAVISEWLVSRQDTIHVKAIQWTLTNLTTPGTKGCSYYRNVQICETQYCMFKLVYKSINFKNNKLTSSIMFSCTAKT